jgi:hypothetical protein
MTEKEMASGNIAGKGKNAENKHFLLFPQSCPPYQGTPFVLHYTSHAYSRPEIYYGGFVVV